MPLKNNCTNLSLLLNPQTSSVQYQGQILESLQNLPQKAFANLIIETIGPKSMVS